jgi:nitrate/TMAO reductase-like tetraheme cytochrome c subunit
MRRSFKLAIVGAACAALVAVAGGAVVFQTTSHSDFCRSCHIMEPYHRSWSISPHRNVPCTECHMPPGFKGKVLTKFQALSQLTKYVTRTYGTRPWAHVADGSCTACHDLSRLERSPRKEFRPGLYFAHAPHLKAEVRHRKLRCTTCHTQVDRSRHMEISTQACYTCHFKPDASGRSTRMAECTTCHSRGMPESAFRDSALAHAQRAVRAKGPSADCQACHQGLVRGDADVPRYRCSQCHNTRDVLALYEKPDDLHRIHVTQAGADCLQCHTEIGHRKPARRPPERASDCRQCHGSAHEAQFRLFAGELAAGGRPSGMFRAGLECSTCHLAGKDGHPQPAELAVRPGICGSCHTLRMNALYLVWQEGVADLASRLDGNIDLVRRAPATPPAMRPVLDVAAGRLASLRKARPIHNLPLAGQVLEEVDDLVRKSAPPALLSRLAALPHRGWDRSGGCVACHFPVATTISSHRGQAFSHEAHGRAMAKKTCVACHAGSGRAHGALGDARTCRECHHPRPAAPDRTISCEGCHQAQRQVFEGKVPAAGLDVAPIWKGKRCTDCHAEPGAAGDRERVFGRCEKCHDPGYDAAMRGQMELTARRLGRLRSVGRPAPPGPAGGSVRALTELLERDGSRGAHHPALYQKALDLLESGPARK